MPWISSVIHLAWAFFIIQTDGSTAGNFPPLFLRGKVFFESVIKHLDIVLDITARVCAPERVSVLAASGPRVKKGKSVLFFSFFVFINESLSNLRARRKPRQ
jgi:hypothetical protein